MGRHPGSCISVGGLSVMFGAAAGCAQQVKIQRAGSTLRAHRRPGYHRKISAGSLRHRRAKAAQLQLRGAAPRQRRHPQTSQLAAAKQSGSAISCVKWSRWSCHTAA